MIYYVNKRTKFLGKLDSDSIPINILTDVRCNVITKTGQLQNVYENGKKLYINKLDPFQYISEYDKDSYFNYKIVDKVGMSKIGGNIDFDIFEKEPIYHTEYKIDSTIYKKELLTSDNAHLFKFDDVMRCEMTNLVNQSEYDVGVYSILDNIDMNNSSFKHLIEGLYVTLGINDSITISLDSDIDITSCKLINIPNTLVYINNNIVINNKCNISSPSKKISIEIYNDTDSELTIINPCILYS